MTTDQEDRDQIAKLKTEAEEILARDSYTPDDEQRVTAITDEVTRLSTRIEQRAQILAASKNPVNVERGYDQGPELLSRVEPWSGDGSVRDRAQAVLERAEIPDEGKAKVQSLVRTDPATAEWTVAASDPAYLSAFGKVLKDPIAGRDTFDESERAAFATASKIRAAMSSTGANGGYLVPFTLDPTVILTNDGSINPMRQVSRVVTSPTNVWHGVSSAGVTAEWLAEASEAADASPTVAQPTVTAYKAAAWVQASFELVHDSDLAAQISAVFADGKDRLEATAMATGNGTSQPKGIVTVLASVTSSRVSATTNASFGLVDVYNVDEALPPRYRPRAAWLGNVGILNKIRRFGEGSTGNASYWTDLGAGTPPTLLGKSVYEFSEMQGSLSVATASNDDVLIFGDYSNYVISDVVGSTVVYEPLVKGASRRPTGEVGWFLYWRVGADDVSGGNAYRMLRV